jgi:hypothetical protein
VSMKDASNGETGTKWILAIFEFIQWLSSSAKPLTLIMNRIFDVPQDFGKR